jgi:ABC-type sugar transport system substrate-binding protein
MKYRNRKAIGILFLLPLLLLLCISIPGCTGENGASDRKRTDGSKESLLIGFSQVNHANPWRIAETNDIKKEAQRRGYRLILTDAESSS